MEQLLEQDPQTDQESPQEQTFAPGELAAFDYSVNDAADLSEDAEHALEAIVRDCAKRDSAARRIEVEQAWQARLFKRGYQHLLHKRGGGWTLPSLEGYKDAEWMQNLELNIYGAHCEILASALTRDVPQCRFEPFNPDYSPDVSAADKANAFKDIFARNNDLKAIQTQAASLMTTDGRVAFYTRYVVDGQRFGFDEAEAETPPTSQFEEITQDMQEAPSDEEGAQQQEVIPSTPTRKPRGREVLSVYGKLECKVPISCDDLSEMMYVILSREVDVAVAKAMFPEIKDKIKVGSAGIGELQLDRLARVNSRLAIQSNFVSGSTVQKDVTLTHVWLRPSAFMDCECTDEVRQELFTAFPEGCLSIWAGKQLCLARAECVDDHIYILQALPGTGQNREALCSKLISVQIRLNDWIELMGDFFVKTVPQKWFDADTFDVAALKNQGNIPGGSHGFQRQPGIPVNEILFIEPSPTHQPSMPTFIGLFFNEYPQFLSGALPSLFGAESNIETVGGMAIQRDQALGRLSTPWAALQAATAAYYKQGVMCAAACREKRGQTQISEAVPGKGIVTLNVADLKGNIYCFPEAGNNFPESWIQRSSRMQMLLTEAGQNPMTMKLLGYSKNLREVKDAIGLQSLEIPEAASYEKQRAEFEYLLKGGPAPNPALVQAQQEMEQHMHDAVAAGEGQQFAQAAPQALQAMQQLPQEVSTVPIDAECDNHTVEAEACLEWLNSIEGQKHKYGSMEEVASFQNVRLHFLEHTAAAKKIKEANTPKPESKPAISINMKDLPAKEAAEAAQNAGLDASEQDFSVKQAADVEADIVKKTATQKPQAPKSNFPIQ